MPRWPAKQNAARATARKAAAPKARTARGQKSKLLKVGDCYLIPSEVLAIEGINATGCRVYTDKFRLEVFAPAVDVYTAITTGKPCDAVEQPPMTEHPAMSMLRGTLGGTLGGAPNTNDDDEIPLPSNPLQ